MMVGRWPKKAGEDTVELFPDEFGDDHVCHPDYECDNPDHALLIGTRPTP